MGLKYKILGKPTQDNALWVEINTGQKVHQLVFDCGEGCISSLTFGDILNIDHLFISHFHMDHISGFDTYFRALFNRDTKPNIIWGPPDSADILQCRFRGYIWNLCADYQVSWFVKEIHEDKIITYRFELNEGFTNKYLEREEPIFDHVILKTKDYEIKSYLLNHGIPSVGYFVQEASKQNIQMQKVKEMGLQAGSWLQQLKQEVEENTEIEIGSEKYNLKKLQQELLDTTTGENIAYITDFLWDEKTQELLPRILENWDTVVCESQYLHEDLELAIKNYHTTVTQTAEQMKKAKIKQLILFHISQRYTQEQWQEILDEAQHIFPPTSFPNGWLK